MLKYIRQPQVVEATRWDGKDLSSFEGRLKLGLTSLGFLDIGDINGAAAVYAGDWIVKTPPEDGEQGDSWEVYPHEIFCKYFVAMPAFPATSMGYSADVAVSKSMYTIDDLTVAASNSKLAGDALDKAQAERPSLADVDPEIKKLSQDWIAAEDKAFQGEIQKVFAGYGNQTTVANPLFIGRLQLDRKRIAFLAIQAGFQRTAQADGSLALDEQIFTFTDLILQEIDNEPQNNKGSNKG